MKSILNPRTVRMALDKVDKRLVQIEVIMAELQVEKDRASHLRAALGRQLPMPLTALEPEPGQDVLCDTAVLAPRVRGDAPLVLVFDSGDCFWATGPHQHEMTGDEVVCLAPEEQRRKP